MKPLTLKSILVLLVACAPPQPSGGRSVANDAGQARTDVGAQASDGGQTPEDAGPPPCVYPTENLGKIVGKTLPPDLSWQAIGPGFDQPRTLSIEEFYDCDGRKAIHALWVITSASWCPSCQSQAGDLSTLMNTWAMEGLNIAVLTLKMESQGQQPATLETLREWRRAFELTAGYLGVDSHSWPSMLPTSADSQIALPMHTLVDPRTMQVTHKKHGYQETHEDLLELARRRAAE